MSTGGSTKAIIAAFFANLGIAITKFVGFFVTGSSSMLAEAVHSCADTGNQALLILGTKRAKHAPTSMHPFGFGRERYFWSFIVALVLFTLGSGFAVFEGVDKIRHPHEINSLGWAVGILIFGLILEGWSFRTAVQEANRVRGRSSWTQFIRNSKTPELPVVLLEDFGALIGLLIALTALLLAHFTEDAVWDGIGTLLIGLLLGAIAFVLAVEMKSLLLGESATPQMLDKIVAAIESQPEVGRIIHLKTQHIGPDELLVGAKISFQGDLDTADLAAAINAIEARVREEVPIARPMYIEPDIYSATHDEPDET
ncbi:MAG: cation diffusion facilitator family transporter [Acidobacteria bacterium]|nr:cation diffusion facilitator family transporter [Acidobacteriota bacterium]